MKKKLMAIFMSLVMVLSISSTGFAASKYQVNTPKKGAISTTKGRVLVSGKAPRGTRISIDLYGAPNIAGKKYSLANLPKNKDYIFISRQNIRSGPAGFGEEIKLIKGINKIVVSFKAKGAGTVRKIVYYYDAKDLKRR